MKMPNDCLIPRQVIRIAIPSQTIIGKRKMLMEIPLRQCLNDGDENDLGYHPFVGDNRY